MPSFRLTGIDAAPFEPLFSLTDEQLAERGAQRCIATAKPGFPCRVSLEDADAGEELLLLPYEHQPAASPYRASGPIFVRRGAEQRALGVDELTSYVTSRLMSVRAYDAADHIIDASVREGTDLRAEIEKLLANDRVAYIHLHNAKRGCFSCRVDRA